MPLDPYLASRLHFLVGLEVSPESLKDEALWERIREFNVDPSPWTMPDLAITELDIPGPHGPIPVRIYEPKNRVPIGCLLWVHGGGFTSGTLDWNEAHVVSAELAARSGAKVVSVDYRLASETVQYPVPLDDVFAAWKWLTTQAASRPEGKMLALGGASAGAALALAAAIRSKEGDERKPDMLLLAYPFVHFPVPALARSVAQEMAPLPDLLRFTTAAIEGMVRTYVGRIVDVPPLALPGHAPLEGLPETHLLVSEYDDLRPSAELLAQQLKDVGTKSSTYLAEGMTHGHLNRFPSLGEVDKSLQHFATLIRAAGEDLPLSSP